MQLVAIFCVGTSHRELGTECARVEHGKKSQCKTSHLDLEMERRRPATTHAQLALQRCFCGCAAASCLFSSKPKHIDFPQTCDAEPATTSSARQASSSVRLFPEAHGEVERALFTAWVLRFVRRCQKTFSSQSECTCACDTSDFPVPQVQVVRA